MVYAFFASLGALTLALVIGMLERYHGKRFGVSVRDAIDHALERVVQRGVRWYRAVRVVLGRESLLKFLHMVTYMALIGVQAVEERLTRATRRLRAFRKRRAVETKRSHLHQVHRESDRAEDREQ